MMTNSPFAGWPWGVLLVLLFPLAILGLTWHLLRRHRTLRAVTFALVAVVVLVTVLHTLGWLVAAALVVGGLVEHRSRRQVASPTAPEASPNVVALRPKGTA